MPGVRHPDSLLAFFPKKYCSKCQVRGAFFSPGVVAVTEVSSICFYVICKLIFHAVITEISVFTPIVNNEQKLALADEELVYVEWALWCIVMPGGDAIGKFEARRNVETFFKRVHRAQPSQDTTAWKKKAKPFHKPVDGHKLMRQRMIKEENLTLNKKLNRIMSEDRKSLTKEYAPGFRVGNVSSGMCIDCYRTENPLSLSFDKLHNRKQIRDREAKVVARHNAELKANIKKLQSPYSATECDKFYRENRCRARFFLERKEDPHTSKHLGLDPRERSRNKREQEAKQFFEMNAAAHQTDALGKAEALSEALSHLALSTPSHNTMRRRDVDGEVFLASGNRTGGSWEPRPVFGKDGASAERKNVERLTGIDRANTSGYQFGLSIERLMDVSLTPIHTPSKAFDDTDFSSFTSTFPLPYNQDARTRPFSTGVNPSSQRRNDPDNCNSDGKDGDVGRSGSSEKVQKKKGKRVVKDSIETPIATVEAQQSPRSNERKLLRNLIEAKTKQTSAVYGHVEQNGPRTRQMRILVQDNVCVSDYGEIKRLSEFPGFEHIVAGSEKDVDISTSSGLLVEVEGAKDVFLDVKSIMKLISQKGLKRYSALHLALRQLACLDHAAGLYECVSDLDPEVESMLADFLLTVIHTQASREKGPTIEIY